MVFSLPFLPYVSMEASAEAADAMIKHPLLVADIPQWNAMPYFFTILPQYEFMGKGKPPKTLDDWKGLRVRAPGAVGEAFAKLGASLSTVPAVELYTALERGTVDAASFPFSYAHAAYQLHTISSGTPPTWRREMRAAAPSSTKKPTTSCRRSIRSC